MWSQLPEKIIMLWTCSWPLRSSPGTDSPMYALGMYDRFFLLKTSLSLILYLHWLPSAGELYAPRTKICLLFSFSSNIPLLLLWLCHFHSFKKNVIWRYNLRLWSKEGSRGINKMRSVPSSNTSARNGMSVIKLQENSKYNDIKVTDQ